MVSDQISAPDRAAALRELTRRGLHVVEVRAEAETAGLFKRRRRKTNLAERVLILRQLAIMARAGIPQLDAVVTVSKSAQSDEGREGLRQVAAALRRGDPFGGAMREAFPAFGQNTIALIELGEASGKLGLVLSDAADDLAAEEKTRKEIGTALTYPAFLAGAGLLAVLFLFYQVVPRFAGMIGDLSNLTGVAAAVMRMGLFVNQNIILVLIGLAGIVLGLTVLFRTPALADAAYRAGHKVPALGSFLRARERARWARSMHLALKSGVTLLRASELSADAVPEGTFRRSIKDAGRSLRSGETIDDIFRRAGTLSEIDLGLLKAGQKSGELAPIFGHIAERYEAEVQETLKRATALIEPLAIAFVAVLIGLIAFALMSALSGVYEQVG
jgi:general secretion pathway protein F